MTTWRLEIDTLDERLLPILDRIPREWGKFIDVSPGWYEIVIGLNNLIAELYPDYEVHQVKNKLGGLRYYCSVEDDEKVEVLIRMAEDVALTTCEVCASTIGVTTANHRAKGSWIETLCAICSEKEGEL